MSSDSFAMEDSSWSISACSGQPAKTAQSSSRFGVPKDHLNSRLGSYFFTSSAYQNSTIFLVSSSVKPPLSTIDLSHFRSENRIGAKGKRLRKTPRVTPPAPPSSCETFHLGRLLLFGSVVGGQLPGAKGFVLDLVGALGLEVGQILLEHLKTPHSTWHYLWECLKMEKWTNIKFSEKTKFKRKKSNCCFRGTSFTPCRVSLRFISESTWAAW